MQAQHWSRSGDRTEFVETIDHTLSSLKPCPAHLELHCQGHSGCLSGWLCPRMLWWKIFTAVDNLKWPGEILVMGSDPKTTPQSLGGSSQEIATLRWWLASVFGTLCKVDTGQVQVQELNLHRCRKNRQSHLLTHLSPPRPASAASPRVLSTSGHPVWHTYLICLFQ